MMKQLRQAGLSSNPTMRCYKLSEPRWTRIAPLLPHRTQRGRAGHSFGEPRPIFNGILWILHTGAPWRDLPECYGPWGTVFKAFNRWRRGGTWGRIFTLMMDELDDRGEIDHDLWWRNRGLVAERHGLGLPMVTVTTGP